MVLPTRGRRSARPAPWTWETGRVVEARHGLLETDLFAAVDESMLPQLLSSVAARADELFEVAVRYFITIDEEVAQVDLAVTRSGPAGQAVLAARHEHHSRWNFPTFQQLHSQFRRRLRYRNTVVEGRHGHRSSHRRVALFLERNDIVRLGKARRGQRRGTHPHAFFRSFEAPQEHRGAGRIA